jgi:carboxymethylenebutenolidase
MWRNPPGRHAGGVTMIEQDIKIGTKYGPMTAFAACPDGPGSHPPVILYMDAPGWREELKNMVRRIARQGYFCVLPDLYYRLGTLRFDIPRRDDAMSSVIRPARLTVTNANVTDDTAGILAWLDTQDKAKPGPVGIAGHCMSGSYVITLAARFPTRIAAGAAYYGVDIVTDKPDSAHLLVDKIKAEIYLSFAEKDATVPDNVIPTIKDALKQHRITHDVEQVPGTLHGYLFAERAAYNPVAAEAAWAKTFALFERRLR